MKKNQIKNTAVINTTVLSIIVFVIFFVSLEIYLVGSDIRLNFGFPLPIFDESQLAITGRSFVFINFILDLISSVLIGLASVFLLKLTNEVVSFSFTVKYILIFSFLLGLMNIIKSYYAENFNQFIGIYLLIPILELAIVLFSLTVRMVLRRLPKR